MNYNLAILYLINKNRLKFLYYSEIVRNEGKDLNERDREALYDANLDYFPDVDLVEARLLLDGGYYDRFEKAIESFEAKNNELLAYELEYLFLKARFNTENANRETAIKQLKKVIELGEDKDYCFASEAALQLGNIYKEMGKTNLAKEYYEKSIKLYKSDYYEYIEDKAAKGLRNL